VKNVSPGTAAYLDAKNGFRDATLGASHSSFENLVLIERDEAHQLETYTRTGDLLSIEKSPLTSIEYSFFKGQLAWITLKWKMEFNDSPSVLPPSSEMARYFISVYGQPQKRSIKKNDTVMAWRARHVRAVLNESRLPGVPDLIRNRWGIPPTTIGHLMIENVELRREFATVANLLLKGQDGL
jgi:hypothetical protein